MNPPSLSHIGDQLQKITDELHRDFGAGYAQLQTFQKDIDPLFEHVLKEGSEIEKNKCWHLKRVSGLLEGYIKTFNLMKQQNYYDAWCQLEQLEIGIATLRKNSFLPYEQFSINEMESLVDRFQQLFPYKIFISPELLINRIECSICNEAVNPWSKCRHLPGKVYDGVECVQIVKDCTPVAISLVTDPVQKYSVVFLQDEEGNKRDHYNYTVIEYVVDRLSSPFDGWTLNWTKTLHPHDRYQHLSETSGCPCDSGKAYGDCCLRKEGVQRPHALIEFEKPIPQGLPTFIYSSESP